MPGGAKALSVPDKNMGAEGIGAAGKMSGGCHEDRVNE